MAKIMVKGGDWIGGTSANPIKMGVPEITRVADIPDRDFADKLALHSSEFTLGEIAPTQTRAIFWQMVAEPGLSGSPHQEVTIDLIC